MSARPAPAHPLRGPAPAGAATAPEAWRRISPLTVWADLIVLTAVIAVPAVLLTGVLAFVGALPWGLLPLPAAVVLIGLVMATEVLRYRATRYRVTAERLEMESGVLARSARSVPLERVRTVDVTAPIWARVLGLCSVTAATGSGGGAAGDLVQLSYVTADEGERLRVRLLDRADARSGGPAAEGGGELAALDPAWFRYAPLSHLVPVLGVGAIGGAYSLLTWFGDQWAAGVAVAVYEYALPRLALVLPGAALVVLVSGAVAATALQVEAWWNYRLSREDDGTLRVRRGLLTAKSLSVQETRLRGAELRAYLPLRWFGSARVAAVATGMVGEDSGSTAAKSVLSPDLPAGVAHRLAADVLAAPADLFTGHLAAHPRAALRRRVLRGVWAAAALTAGAVALAWAVPAVPGWSAAVVAAVALPGLVGYAVGAYRGLGHALLPGHLVLRRGMAARRTVALQREGIIGWRVRRSPFQRRVGLATVGATTAAGAGLYAAVDVDLASGVALAADAVPGLLDPFVEAA
jgi:putative membrane protein